MSRFCPTCEGEYEDWVRECWTCAAPLVSSLPRRVGPAPYDGPISPALVYESHPEAVAVCQYLTAAGVRAWVPEEGWNELGAIGGWRRGASRVWVADDDVERARRLLDERDEAEAASAARGARVDFFDYEAAGPISSLDDYPRRGSRSPRALFRGVGRTIALAINALFVANLVTMIWPSDGDYTRLYAAIPLTLLFVGLVWLTRRI